MSKFKLFAERATSGDARGAIQIWRDSSSEILSEYRKARDEEEGGAWYSGGFTIFDKLIWSGVKGNDPVAINTVRALIEAGVMLNERDRAGYTPVGLLSLIGNLDLLKHAVRHGGDVNAGEENALAMMFGSREPLQNWQEQADFLIAEGADVNARSDQTPPIFNAIDRNQREAITYLVKQGADLNRLFDVGEKISHRSAMHYSLVAAFAHHTDLETGRLLIDLGGDPTIKNRDGFGAIDAFIASDRDQSENVAKLIELYSSAEEWRQASWYLTTPPPSSFNPHRKRQARSASEERVWSEIPGIRVAFRIGDRVKVIRRAGLYGNRVSLTLLGQSGETDCDRDMRAMPGTTGTIVRWYEYLDYHWKAMIEFDPGTWEEADNFGQLRKIGRCRGHLFADCLEIIEPAGDRTSEPAGSAPQSPSGTGLESLARNWKLLVVIVAIIIAALVLT